MVDSYGDSTWWQSGSNVENVTIEIDFQKLFFFTYVIISFSHVRPAVMSLEKSIDRGQSYQPFLYYANDCTALAAELPGNDNVPCTSLYSLPTPGEVRPSFMISYTCTCTVVDNWSLQCSLVHTCTCTPSAANPIHVHACRSGRRNFWGEGGHVPPLLYTV